MAIIEVENVTKEYKLGHLLKLKDSVNNIVCRLRGKALVERERFKALDGVSLKIEEGEIVGIIGANGAGKSTLLKLLSRITSPTSGNVAVGGTIAPLIEVGAGFVPDLTGRENIYLNGAILGMSKKVLSKKFGEIVEFAELEEFIDTPIKRYSSGMVVRLGFAIATSIDADILIVDEVLAVGDLSFQRKCFDRLEDKISRQGKTIIIVSHSIRKIERLCTRTVLLDHGKIVMDGKPSEVCRSFYERSNEKIYSQIAKTRLMRKNVQRSGEVDLQSAQLVDEEGNPTNEVCMGGPVTIRGIFTSNCEVKEPEITYGFHTTDFVYISSMGTAHIEDRPALNPGENVVECHIAAVPLLPGIYCLRASVFDRFHRKMFQAENVCVFSVTSTDKNITRMPSLGMVYIPARWRYESKESQA